MTKDAFGCLGFAVRRTLVVWPGVIKSKMGGEIEEEEEEESDSGKEVEEEDEEEESVKIS